MALRAHERSGRIAFGFVLAMAVLLGCLSQSLAITTVDTTLKVNQGVGVGFDQLSEDSQTLTINLNAPSTWQIASSKRRDNAGRALWLPIENNTKASTHTYSVTGVVQEDGCAAGFEGTLTKDGSGQGGTPPSFDAAVADLDINLPYDSIGGEEPSGGLVFPILYPHADFPTNTNGLDPAPANLTVRLRLMWKGPPTNPTKFGTLSLTPNGAGVAIYKPDGSALVPQSIDIGPGDCDANNTYTKTYKLLTNNNFTGAATVSARFTWDSSLFDATPNPTAKYATDEKRLIKADAGIYADSNNDGTDPPDETNAADLAEKNADGKPGKRIFVNSDDDNKNGVADNAAADQHHGAYVLNPNANPVTFYTDKDLAKIKLVATNPTYLQGYELWLSCSSNLKLYASESKQWLNNDTGDTTYDNVPTRSYTIPTVAGGWYKWSLGPQTPALSLPQYVYAEGIAEGPGMVYLRIVKTATGEVFKRDALKVNVEKTVWPNQDPNVTTDVTKTTTEWNGFVLPPGWFHSSSLCQIINGTAGYVRTQYPQETSSGRWQGTSAQNSNATLNLATLCGTTPWPANMPVRIIVAYEFEQSPRITTGQYADTNYTLGGNLTKKEGFFHNSGIKVESVSEIQIIDTASLLDAINNGHQAIIGGNTVTISANSNNDINATGKVLLQDTGSNAWLEEPVNGLISGIPYLTGPNTLAALSCCSKITYLFV